MLDLNFSKKRYSILIKRFSWVTLAKFFKTTTITKKANIASRNEKKQNTKQSKYK